jgi:hypothetical protein
LIRKRFAALGAAVAVVGGTLGVVAMSASANVTGSTFESTDANQVVDTAGNLDWQNAPHLSVGTDLPTGQLDNAFGQGTSENDTAVTIVDGSIPNSKADLGRFATASETIANGDVMMYLAWIRNNTGGTTNFDFELNKAPQPVQLGQTFPPNSSVPITLNRTAGDVLINYALQGGSQTPTLTRRIWSGSAWGAEVPFDASIADGSTNTNNAITNFLGNTISLPTVPKAEFGEAAIDMTKAGIIPNQNDPNAPCAAFGSAFVKSRSSSSFTSEIKDYIAPIPLNLSNCGTIKIVKVTDPNPDPTNTAFAFTPSYETAFSLHNGDGGNLSGPLKAGGQYSVSETPTPGWDPTSATCDNGTIDHIAVVADQTTTCTFTNTARGNIIVKKLTDPSTDTSTSFNFTASYNAAGFSLTNGQQNDSGKLIPGTYSVAEGAEPAGWIPLNSSCSDGSPINAISLQPGETVTCTFTNQAQGRIIVHKVISGPADTTTQFGFTSNYGAPFSLNSTQTNDSGFLNTGTYNVAETPQANWKLVGSSCTDGSPVTAISLQPGEVINCTFVNQLQVGSITIVKTRIHKADGPGDHPEANVTFSVSGPSGTFNVTTDASGHACVDNLFFGNYTVTETVPTGESADVNPQMAAVNSVSYCNGSVGDGNGQIVSFHNVPLTDIHVQAHSEVPGGTLSTINCSSGATGGPAGDANADSIGLKPGTYTCTVVVDP